MGHYTKFSGPREQGPEDRGPGTQGPKLACTMHVRTVALNLGKYPGPQTFCAWVFFSNHMEWAIELLEKHLNHFSI